MASRNEATGDVIAAVKGSTDAYAEGLDFAKNPPEEWLWDSANPRILSTQVEVDEMNSMPVPSVMRVTWRIGDTCCWRKGRLHLSVETLTLLGA